MPRNIVLCCDGTANEFAKDRTNVVKLFYAGPRSACQPTYYHPRRHYDGSVGTITMTTRKSPSCWRRIGFAWKPTSATPTSFS